MRRMSDKDNYRNKAKSIYYGMGAVALTAVGAFVVPPLLKKISNKLYKKSAKKEKIDFEKLGPEIVKKADEQREEMK